MSDPFEIGAFERQTQTTVREGPGDPGRRRRNRGSLSAGAVYSTRLRKVPMRSMVIRISSPGRRVNVDGGTTPVPVNR